MNDRHNGDNADMDRMLELFREAQSPSGAARERVWQAVEEQVMPPPAGQGGGGATTPPGAASSKGTLIGAAAVVSGAALLFVALSGRPDVEPAHLVQPAPPAQAAAPAQLEAAQAQAAPLGSAAPAALEEAPAVALQGERVAPEPGVESRRERSASAPAARATLAAEMKLLTAAQQAARAGDHASALATLQRHRASFPRGVMAEEREAERVFALCALGREAQAAAVRVRFLARFDGSPLAPRVRRACGEAP